MPKLSIVVENVLVGANDTIHMNVYSSYRIACAAVNARPDVRLFMYDTLRPNVSLTSNAIDVRFSHSCDYSAYGLCSSLLEIVYEPSSDMYDMLTSISCSANSTEEFAPMLEIIKRDVSVDYTTRAPTTTASSSSSLSSSLSTRTIPPPTTYHAITTYSNSTSSSRSNMTTTATKYNATTPTTTTTTTTTIRSNMTTYSTAHSMLPTITSPTSTHTYSMASSSSSVHPTSIQFSTSFMTSSTPANNPNNNHSSSKNI